MMTNALIPPKLSDLLAQEQGLGPVRHLDDLQARLQRRSMMARQIQQWEEALRQVQRQYRVLPALPPLKVIRWAQAVRAMPNLVFLEVDTTGLQEDAEIVRVSVLNIREETLLDCLVTPSQPLSRQMVTITGISNSELQSNAVPIDQALDRLRQVLHGAYVLCYNLEFDVGKLRGAAQRHRLDEITIIGEDLMERAMSYLHLTSYPKLESLCQQLGQPLPPQPRQTALDRARGQIDILNAIADVTFAALSSLASQSTGPEQP